MPSNVEHSLHVSSVTPLTVNRYFCGDSSLHGGQSVQLIGKLPEAWQFEDVKVRLSPATKSTDDSTVFK